MRVDLICGSYPPEVCGVGDYTRRLTKELHRQGVGAEVITTKGRDIDADADVPAAALARDWTVADMSRLSRALSERGAGIVHIQFPTRPYQGKLGIHILPLLLRRLGMEVVTTLHEYCMAPGRGRIKQLLNVRFSHRIVVTNQQDLHLLAPRASPGKIQVMPIGSNIEPTGTSEEGRELLRLLGAEAKSRSLLYFGFVRPGKGLEAALEALASIQEVSPSNLVIASPPPSESYRKHLERQSAMLGLNGKIKWAGYRPEREVSSLMLACRAAVLPFEDGATERRGSLVAALVHGLPVVTTVSESTPEAFVSGENMLLSAVGDVRGLASNVAQVLESDDLATNISKGAALLGESYSWGNIARRTIELYESMSG